MEFISKELLQYSEHHSDSEEEILQELVRETHLKFLSPRMLSGHLQGNLLQFLAKINQSKNILEIGTYTGYSGICLAKALPEDGMLTTIDVNPETEWIAKKYFEKSGFQNKINYITGNALEIIPSLTQKFDFVFIDADKKNYSNYFDLVVDKVSSGGLIIADNVLWSGKILMPAERMDSDTLAIHQFNEKISKDKRISKILLPIRDGIFVMRKK
jgi:caffeoyl-CoA O-methyltransferase